MFRLRDLIAVLNDETLDLSKKKPAKSSEAGKPDGVGVERPKQNSNSEDAKGCLENIKKVVKEK